MINEEIAEIFDKMSRVLAFKGANRFRALAYEHAARSLRDLDEDLTVLAREGKLEEIPGIGQDLAGKIEEYIKTKRIRLYDQARRGAAGLKPGRWSIRGSGPNLAAGWAKDENPGRKSFEISPCRQNRMIIREDRAAVR
jgi:DNA polymerase (family 10)